MPDLRVTALWALLLGTPLAYSAPPPPPATSDSNSVGTLSLSSVPPDADVFVDGKLMGRTPVHLPGVPVGLRTLRLVRPGFCDYVDSLNVLEGLENDISVDLDSACGFSVTSMPESAAVYVDQVPAGSSPVTLNARTGWTHLKVTKPGYTTWEKNVYLRPGVTLNVAAELRSTTGRLSLDVASKDIDVVVDGETIGGGSLVNHSLPEGWHDIGARKHGGVDSVSEKIYVPAGESVRWQAQFDVSSRKAPIWAVAVPGLGQIIGGSTAKGMEMIVGFTAACIFTAIENSRYFTALDDYNGTYDRYRIVTTEFDAKSTGDALKDRYQKLTPPRNLRTAGLVLVGAAYIYSLVDALLEYQTVNTLTLAEVGAHGISGPELAITGDGGRVTLCIRF